MQAPSPEELKRINDLVREAVGFNQARGDTISVASASFVPPEPDLAPELPVWKDPEMIALGKEIGKYLIFALIAFLVWRKLLQPIFEMIAATAHRVEAEEEKAAEEALEGFGEEGTREPTFEERVQEAREIAHNDPKLVAELIKEWLGANGT